MSISYLIWQLVVIQGQMMSLYHLYTTCSLLNIDLLFHWLDIEKISHLRNKITLKTDILIWWYMYVIIRIWNLKSNIDQTIADYQQWHFGFFFGFDWVIYTVWNHSIADTTIITSLFLKERNTIPIEHFVWGQTTDFQVYQKNNSFFYDKI